MVDISGGDGCAGAHCVSLSGVVVLYLSASGPQT
jgi:hypothetical protein